MKYIGIIVLVLAVIGAGYYVMSSTSQPAPEAVMQQVSEASVAVESADAQMVTLDSFEFGYSQKELTVKKGQTVQVTLTNSGKMPHDWVVDEIAGAKTQMIKNGEATTITFVAGTAGEFEYYCSVGQHRQLGMVGKLIVEE